MNKTEYMVQGDGLRADAFPDSAEPPENLKNEGQLPLTEPGCLQPVDREH